MGPGGYQRVRTQAKPQLPKTERLSRMMFENLIANRRTMHKAA